MQNTRGASGKRKENKNSKPQKAAVGKSIKGAVFALVVTVVCVLIFAVIVKQAGLSNEEIGAVNQTIKVVCIFLAALIASRNVSEGKILAGIMAGAIYVVLGYLTFSLIDGQFGDIMMMFADLVMGVVIGMLTAMVFSKVFVKQPEKTAKKA